MLATLLKAYPWFEHAEGMKFVEIEQNAHRSVGHWLFLPGAISVFHQVNNSDEIWAIHSGKLVLHVLAPGGTLQTFRLGVNVGAGEVPVATVPAGYWQAAELPGSVPFAFGSNVCAPAFAYSALVIARRAELCRIHPQHAELITRLTHR